MASLAILGKIPLFLLVRHGNKQKPTTGPLLVLLVHRMFSVMDGRGIWPEPCLWENWVNNKIYSSSVSFTLMCIHIIWEFLGYHYNISKIWLVYLFCLPLRTTLINVKILLYNLNSLIIDSVLSFNDIFTYLVLVKSSLRLVSSLYSYCTPSSSSSTPPTPVSPFAQRSSSSCSL